jgi:hypothetical protein
VDQQVVGGDPVVEEYLPGPICTSGMYEIAIVVEN